MGQDVWHARHTGPAEKNVKPLGRLRDERTFLQNALFMYGARPCLRESNVYTSVARVLLLARIAKG